MKCPKCGFEINEKDTICRSCGESVLNLKKAVENNTINTPIESTQIINNQSLPIDNENITSKQDLNYNSASSTFELEKEETNKETIKETEELSSLKKDMKCSKCGASIQNNWNFCPNCHNKINDDVVNNEEKYIPSKEENKIFWIVIICILSPVISNILTILLSYFMYYLGENISTLIYLFLTYLTPMCYIIALILLVYGKNKYPRNKTIKITFIIFITLFVLAIIFFAIAIPIMLVQFIEACRTMG